MLKQAYIAQVGKGMKGRTIARSTTPKNSPKMINSLTIKNVATYDESGVEIKDLKKVNFIYGANGSGKTTITKCLNKPDEEHFFDCNVVWQNEMPIKTLVYNKDFKDRNFGKGNIDGVFTLGQATKEQTEEIEEKKEKRRKLKEDGITKKKTLDGFSDRMTQVEDGFKEEAWFDIYKKYDTDFKDAFRGVLQKESFKNKLVDEFKNNSAELFTYTELKEKASTIFGKTPTALPLIAEIVFTRIIEIEKEGIWKKKIVGKADVDIAKLIQKLNLSDWVKEGRDYLQEDETCPFCQQKTITEDFKSQLEGFFDESYIADIDLVKSCAEEYIILAENISNTLQQIENAEKVNEETKLDIFAFPAYIKTFISQLASNKELLHNKIKEPSRSIELVSVNEQLENIQDLIFAANKEIQKHNTLVSNYKTERANLIEAIWKFILDENKTRIQNFLKNQSDAQKGLDALTKRVESLRKQFKQLDEEVIRLSKNVTSVQPSVDEINKSLSSYGFQNFVIVPSKTGKNQYQIQREDGTLAESTLSEGEATFITFLYFLQLAKGSTSEDNISDERILVIDDPISSLDSNVLFVVSSLLKEIIKSIKKDSGSIKQIVLFTHNVYFHKEVSFIDGRTKECNQTSYWILRKVDNISKIQFFEMKNPVQNSYELLWMELKNKDQISGITIQNTMRKIIENYFKILGKYGDDELISQFTNAQEQEICRSLICWINDGSHCIPDDLFIERQETTVDNYFEVFKNIFVHTNHIEHYNMMMGAKTVTV